MEQRSQLPVKAVAHLIESEDYDPKNLVTFGFNCKDVVVIFADATPDRVQLVEKQVKELACR